MYVYVFPNNSVRNEFNELRCSSQFCWLYAYVGLRNGLLSTRLQASVHSYHYYQWAPYKMRKIPVMHAGIVTSVSFEVVSGENFPGIPGACAIRNFAFVVRGPWEPDTWLDSSCQYIVTFKLYLQEANAMRHWVSTQMCYQTDDKACQMLLVH